MGEEDADEGASDPTSVVLACYASLADMQAVLAGDPEDDESLKVREGRGMRLAASFLSLARSQPALPSSPFQLRADLQAAAAEAQALIPPPSTAPYTPTWTEDPLTPPPVFAELASSPAHSDLASALAAGNGCLDFSSASAVRSLSRALLMQCFGLTDWTLSDGALVPPIAARAAYLRRMGLIVGGGVPPPHPLSLLDVGTGANLIFPLLAASPVFGWSATGLDVTPAALSGAAANLALNPSLASRIRLVAGSPTGRPPILAPALGGEGGTDAASHFDFSVCNPPFFESDAARATTAKDPGAAHGGGHAGTAAETVWQGGGEAGFVCAFASESAAFPHAVTWFSSLLGRKASLTAVRGVLGGLRPQPEVRTFTLAEGGGRTTRWVVAWSWVARVGVKRRGEGDEGVEAGGGKTRRTGVEEKES